MKRAGVMIGIFLIVAAYVYGFWPQYQKARQAQRDLAAATGQLAHAQSELRLCALQARLLAIIGQASDRNYGNASVLATPFFDQVRREADQQSEPQAKAALESILAQRDAVTSDLAKGDPGSLNVLEGLENTMFNLVERTLNITGAAPRTP
jgi:type II secretory pathway pseudopilin PulG